MTMTLRRPESDARAEDSVKEIQDHQKTRKEALEQVIELTGKSIYVTAVVTHTFEDLGGGQVADIFISKEKVTEITDAPAIIVGTVSNVVFFRAVDDDGEVHKYGAYVENLHAYLAVEPYNLENVI